MKAEYVDHMGNDMSVANAARVSFEKLAKHFPEEENRGLIRFLARGIKTGDWDVLVDKVVHCENKSEAARLLRYVRKIPLHWVPFAHTAITLRMGAPVPIRTQAFKHKQGLVESEESRRYIKSRPEIYLPEEFRSAPEGSIKQGSAGVHPRSKKWKQAYSVATNAMVELYLEAIEDGVCPEQARFFLPQGAIVNWIWTGNLYSFANFFNSRSDSHDQVEIQELSQAVSAVVEALYPVSWKALTEI